jgi:Zn-finger nucleic acid-binding protein
MIKVDRDEEVAVNCPKCEGSMEKATYHNIEIDRCTDCKGIWFDMLEREHLEKLDEIECAGCPVCGTQMILMVDPVQPHVAYETCKVCYGVFLDAGEFTDLKERTLLDRLRSLLARERL